MQWENPRVPPGVQASTADAASDSAPLSCLSYDNSGPTKVEAWLYQYHQTTTNAAQASSYAGSSGAVLNGPAGRYNPAIHGSWDPNADYAKEVRAVEDAQDPINTVDTEVARNLIGAAHFNRVTGAFQTSNENRHSDENKSKRQMEAFFNVDVAANSHDGKSLKAERRNKKLNREQLKAFQEKRRSKKEEKRRAWLRD